MITSGYISKLETRQTKVRDWIIVITLPFAKTLKQSIIYEKIDEKEAEELKKIYNHYLDKRSEIMEKTQIKVEDLFNDIIYKDFYFSRTIN